MEGVEETPPDDGADLKGLRAELSELEATLREVQGNEPLMHPWVDANAVAAIIANWTGVPMGKMLRDELTTVRRLDAIIKERVVGQDHGLAAIANASRRPRPIWTIPASPSGSSCWSVPQGLAGPKRLWPLPRRSMGGERNLITINMSEFQEKHTVSSLKGAPPGYVGYGEGGVLTEVVRRKPYSVVLLDEIEKAHPDVLKLFYQVFDKGVMDDGQGREINFKNTILLMTSNLGTAQVMEATERGQKRPSIEALVQAIHPALLTHLEPALLGRMVVIPYYPLADDQLTLIVNLKLGKIQRRMQGQRIAFQWTASVVEAVVARCTEVDSGARNVDNILSKTLLPEISNEVLARMAEGNAIASIGVDYVDDAGFTYDIGVEEG